MKTHVRSDAHRGFSTPRRQRKAARSIHIRRRTISTWAMLTKRRLQGSRVAKETNGPRRLFFQLTTLVPPSRALCYIQRCPRSTPVDMAKLPSRSLHFHLQSQAKAWLPPYRTMRCRPRKGPDTTAVEVHHTHSGHISCLSATLQHAYRTGHLWPQPRTPPPTRQKHLPISGR
ncbi:uncharacterized protein LY79DRAFT_3588 [Colletotrichum navitas]|uniref:Uncharacterized protein n=1 Tax=Colletotrichum navitas TaxID=681940 RepID=A0AAD8QEQ8_9PEZI|nr:uncharacterized protein LY79DRAFT_3588 [Colletotrichum navitas]KAK1599998.1 hypothetical protein LY79DRAFT_3588 [Colletotrichum navitas]